MKKYRITAIGGTHKLEGEPRPFFPGVVRRVSLETAQKAAAQPECFKVLEPLPGEAAKKTVEEPSPAEDEEAGEEGKPDEIPEDWEEKLKEYNKLVIKDCDDWLDKVSHVPFLEFLAERAEKKGSKQAAQDRIKEIQKAQD